MDDIYKATGIVIKDKKLLVVRAKGMKFFIDPGGKIEAGETPKQALVRELKEEISIDVTEDDLEPFGNFQAEAANHPGRQVHMQAFIVTKWQGDIRPASEIEDMRWVGGEAVGDARIGSIFGGEVLPRLKAQGLVD
jgi:8-oxo-dGTP diphosphatase